MTEAEETRENAHQDVYKISGIDCMDCVRSMEKVLGKIKGVHTVKTSFFTSKLMVQYDKDQVSDEKIVGAIKNLGYGVEKDYTIGQETSKFAIVGMHCADCAAKIEKSVAQLEGVRSATIDFIGSTLTIEHELGFDPGEVVAIIRKQGYDVELQGSGQGPSGTSRRRVSKSLLTALAGLFIGMGLIFAAFDLELLEISMYLLAIVTAGYYTARAGFYAIRTFTLDINFLMIVAVVGAIYLGEWTEAAMVMFLFSLAEVLEGYAVERSRKSIRSLMDLTPKEVRIKTEGGEKQIPVEELQEGEIFLVRPGERIATDGEIVKGWSYVDQAPITGESTLVGKGDGDEVFGGSINQQGFLEIRATRDVSCNTLAEIIHLVEKAQSRKATAQRFVDRFARVYTPAMLLLAILVVAIPVLVFQQDFENWLYSGLVLLVISCPCALVISTPVAIVSAITNAAKNGILIKGGSYLEAMGTVQAIAFDKTGTITEGRPRVTKIVPRNGYPEQEILRIAAGLERQSEHHLARAIVQKAEVEGVAIPTETQAFEAIKGKGAKGIIENKTYYIGNQALLEEVLPADQGNADLEEVDGATIVFVAAEEAVMGIILLEDRPRHQSKSAIGALRQQGIKSVTMLTGDNAANAKKVAHGVGITDVQANLLPGQKVEAVQELLKRYKAVAMVGDGINDAPALATATVGIAMGGVGMDVSLETADVVLMSDDPGSVAHTVSLSRKALRIIRENIIIALGLKLSVFILALFGLATLWMAVFADTGASLIVITNSLRLLFMENRVKSSPRLA